MGTTCEGLEGLEGFEVGRCGEVERCGGWDAWFNSGVWTWDWNAPWHG